MPKAVLSELCNLQHLMMSCYFAKDWRVEGFVFFFPSHLTVNPGKVTYVHFEK